MSEYINDFDEVCQSGSNTTTDRRPATELELSQAERITELEAERDRLTNELGAAKKRRQEIDDEAFEYADRITELEAIVEAGHEYAEHYKPLWIAAWLGLDPDWKPVKRARRKLFGLLATREAALAQHKEQDDE